MRPFAVLALVAPLALVACKKKAPGSDDLSMVTEQAAPAAPSAATVAELAANFRKVHFALDSAVLDASSQAVLAENATILKAHPSVLVEIEGHADERGTTDYNLALGEKRAASVRSYLVGQGVPDAAVKTVSYGEERPAITGAGETVWAENRRAEFRILVGEGLVGTVP